MAKTYNTFTNVSTGDVYTAAAHNNILTNLGNYRVPPTALVSRVTTQSISNSVFNNVQFTAEGWDTDDIATLATNNDRLTIKTAGIYLVTANAMFAANATGQREMTIVQSPTPAWTTSGTIASTAFVYGTSSVNIYQAMSASVITTCAVNDYFTVQVWQNSGGALNLQCDIRPASLSVTWLGQVS